MQNGPRPFPPDCISLCNGTGGRMPLWMICLVALALSGCCCGDPESETSNIKDGDLVLLDVSALVEAIER